jgi:hypothetical protein
MPLSDATKHAFHVLKESMCTTLVLAMLEFTKTFNILECDAPEKGISVVFMQERCSLTFTNKKLSDKNLASTHMKKK